MSKILDELAVDLFAAAMKHKLAEKRAEGKGGWEKDFDENTGEGCSLDFLRRELESHSDPIHIANFAMMIWNRNRA